MYPVGVERSLGFVAMQPRNGTITIPAEARRALRLDLPGAQVEVILRDHDLVLLPHVAVPLERVRDNGAAPGHDPARWPGRCRRPGLARAAGRAAAGCRDAAGPGAARAAAARAAHRNRPRSARRTRRPPTAGPRTRRPRTPRLPRGC